ncbi:hypothetical protein ACHAXT_007133 [Thalassiosira profunda]
MRMLQKRASSTHQTLTRDVDAEWSLATGLVITKIRGGSSSEESEEYDEEESSEEYDSEEYDSDSEKYDSDSESEEEEEEASQSSLKSSLVSKSKGAVEYDDLLAPPAMQQFAVSIGVMMLANRIDIMDTKVVRIARFAFLAYIISVQAFLLYVRLRAKAMNDRTPITLSNPLASLVQNGAGGGGNFMVKALADQVLSTQTTVLEYDLKQAKKMNGGLLFPMVFLYFLHFKMKQVQPLLMQTATGFSNLVYSPLFQIYIMGRNLERPFKPPANPMMEALQAQQNGEGSGASTEEEEVTGEETEDDEEQEDSDDEDEYDSDDE